VVVRVVVSYLVEDLQTHSPVEDAFSTGHIGNATQVEEITTNYKQYSGCAYCEIVVYGDQSNSASTALALLGTQAFGARLYNGGDYADWTGSGFPVSTADSATPPCKSDLSVSESCRLAWLALQNSTVPPAVAPSANAPSTPAASSSRPRFPALTLFFVLGVFLFSNN
jgi:hypothetical protein